MWKGVVMPSVGEVITYVAVVVAYPEGSGYSIIKVVYSNAVCEYFLGETEENHG
jgi:hypothetical protein